MHLVNAYTMALISKKRAYAEVFDSGVSFPDGKPLMWLSRLLPYQRLNQVRGPALFLDAIDLGQAVGLRHLFLGSTPQTLEAMSQALRKTYPGLEIVGTISPPFRQLSRHEIAAQKEEILLARPHIIWVGLGTPKQDYEALQLAQSTKVLSVAVGAAFDFAAGTKAVAPHWLQSMGLEWAFRLYQEPRAFGGATCSAMQHLSG